MSREDRLMLYFCRSLNALKKDNGIWQEQIMIPNTSA